MPDNHTHRTRRRPRELPGDPASQHDSGWEIADLVAVGVLDAVTGQPPVPISVWRATGPDEPPTTPHALYTGLTPRVAAILIAIYTDPDDLILDATADPTVAGAAGAGGRRYQPLTLPTRQEDLAYTAPTPNAGLVLLRWPTTPEVDLAGGLDRIQDEAVLSLCAQSLTADGHCVAILAPPAGGTYRDHAHALVAAAGRVGLGYLQHVVVITGTDGSNPDSTHASDESHDAEREEDTSRREHLDLLVLVLAPPARPALRPRPRRTT